ncbi:MAG: ATP-dependent helicase [Deltaproteobacteria bacterium]
MPITLQQKNAAELIQNAAAHDNSQQIRLVAGPGTGKSFAIEERISWLIDNGANANNIFVVSFTRAAYIDLRSRIMSHCINRGITTAEQLNVSTLHSLALKILRAAGLLVAYPADPIVMDQWELENIFDAEFSNVSNITNSRCRDIRRNHEAFWSTSQWGPPNYIPPDPSITSTERSQFDQFHTPRTQIYSCVLPGEIVRQCNESITSGTLNPVDLLNIEHLIVDEYQDLNPCDLEFVDNLIQRGVKTFVAGDDDQSIYSFRFASPQGIEDFVNKYPSAGDHVLQDCFRCTPNIVNTAESLITTHALTSRIPKTLNSLYSNSNPIVQGYVFRWQFPSGIAESRAIAESCNDLIQAGISPRDILILLSNTRVLEADLLNKMDEAQVPYEVSRTNEYISSNDGRFLLACLRILCNRDDYVAHRIIIGSIQGVGTGTCNNIANDVLQNNLNFRDIFYINLPSGVFRTRALNAINSARTIVSEISRWQPTDTLNQRATDLESIINGIFGSSGIQNWNNYISTIPGEITLRELRDYLWADNEEQEIRILNALYERIGQPLPNEGVLPQRVRIMTMHASKGLSSKIVFIPGLEEEILPGGLRRPYPGLILEAARLLYMSITRSRVACVLSFASTRILHGGFSRHTASRFNTNLGGIFNYCHSGGLSSREIADILQDTANL